ncbi:MAG TPA: autotransporter outer membrane beta-barrel domain-containing protein [Caulobacteraceae bacterium]|nr:autotransporter outer membrane beta-barrel domain-containing protein [Caulobacteraceae bacterium]
MRFRLMTATALAPLCLMGLRGLAWAQTDTISSSTSTAVQTATAVSGGPGNIDVAAGGAVSPSGGTAVTLNSANTVSVEGTVSVANANNAIAVLATNGGTGAINLAGTISLTESYTPTVNSDGYTNAPFAQGTARYGLQTNGSYTGTVSVNGAVTVQGNQSYGVAILNGLQAAGNNLYIGQETVATGSVTVTGDNSYGVFTQGSIAGLVQIASSVSVTGVGGGSGTSTGGNAVQITGPVTGSLSVYSALTSSGYSSDTRPGTQAQLNLVQATPAQVQQGGSALVVAGSVGGGIFLAAQPSGTTSSSTADADGDGVADGSEGTSALATYGRSPALVIGGAAPITIGEYGSCNAANYGLLDHCFGLIVDGSITASGVYDGVASTAVDIGAGSSYQAAAQGANAGGAGVSILGGMRIGPSATISASAYKANATAIQLESGANLPLLQNEGTVASTLTSATANASTALFIQPGATLSTVTNFGIMEASVTGDSASSYVVVDKSGSVTTFNNYGTLEATITPANAGETTTGSTVAVDLRASSGVTFTQAVSSQTSSPPTTVGDVLLSNTGRNDLELLYGEIAGTVSLGSGANSTLNLEGGGTIQGKLIYTGNSLSIDVGSGKLNNQLSSVITGTSLTVGSGSTLGFALDPRLTTLQSSYPGVTLGTSTEYKVGTANIANGATIAVTFLSAPSTTQSFTVIQANSLTSGAPTLAASAPFLFNTSVQANTATGAVTVTVSPKTAVQLSLNKAETAALPAIYASLSQDSGILNALANASTSSSFHQAYQQMLPDSSGDVFEVVSAMSKAVARSAARAADFESPDAQPNRVSADDSPDEEDDIGTPGGLWASEYIIGLNQDRQDNEAYRAAGLGLVGGVDFGGIGADLSFASANVVKPHDPGDSIVSINHLQLGLYATPQFGILHTEASFSGGYLRISERREFAATVLSGDESTSTAVSRTANAAWNGYDFSGHIGASAPFDITQHLFLTPEVHMDYYDVSEQAYKETGGGLGFDTNVNARTSTQGTITAGVIAGAHIGSSFVFKPQIELGWDDVVTGGPAATTARFAYGGPSFTLVPDSVSGGAAVARLRLQGDGAFVHFALEAGGEFRSDYQNADLRAVFRVSY